MDPETQRLINLIKVTLRLLGVTNREVARRMGLSPSYISKLFSGASELRLDHVIRICRAVSLEPAEFFSLAYPRQAAGSSVAASTLRDLIGSVQLPPPPPPKPTPQLDEEQIQEILKATLDRMMGRQSA
ncbi:MAG TPA: helix-turn-helix transcriptional regulator [Thermoanaerobaculia bacterium]|jgi:transcriptional regulator with XRE-family HTH domain|nr:helix-turn-helix transcriptional regulator [Thermoanaerobaculia bacterium]